MRNFGLTIGLLLLLAAPAGAQAAGIRATLDGVRVSVRAASAAHCLLVTARRLECYSSEAARDALLAASAAKPVTLYENVEYGGGSLATSISISSLGSLGWNDRASSLRVASGYTGRFYLNANWGGSVLTRSGSGVSDLRGLGFNDAISSLRVG